MTKSTINHYLHFYYYLCQNKKEVNYIILRNINKKMLLSDMHTLKIEVLKKRKRFLIIKNMI